MPLLLQVPDQYGLVLAVASSSFFIGLLHGVLTGAARKKSGHTYPVSYASEEQANKDRNSYLFNCAQRGHSNFTENHTSFLGGLLISGLQFPTVSAVLGATWVLGRISYAIGYAKNGPKGRLMGFYPALTADLLLRGMACYTSVMFVLGQ